MTSTFSVSAAITNSGGSWISTVNGNKYECTEKSYSYSKSGDDYIQIADVNLDEVRDYIRFYYTDSIVSSIKNTFRDEKSSSYVSIIFQPTSSENEVKIYKNSEYFLNSGTYKYFSQAKIVKTIIDNKTSFTFYDKDNNELGTVLYSSENNTFESSSITSLKICYQNLLFIGAGGMDDDCYKTYILKNKKSIDKNLSKAMLALQSSIVNEMIGK